MRWLPIPILATVAVYFLVYVPVKTRVSELKTSSGVQQPTLELRGYWPAGDAAALQAAQMKLAKLQQARHRRKIEILERRILPAIKFGVLPAPLLIWLVLFIAF